MGYTTTFVGKINIAPPLSLPDYNKLRAMADADQRDEGPGKVPNAPGCFCQWEPSPDGTSLAWDGNEKFYDSFEWMQYIVAGLAAKGYVCNGTISASGEETTDVWQLSVVDNVVSKQEAKFTFDEPTRPTPVHALTDTKRLT